MKLSICIPVYNSEPHALLSALLEHIHAFADVELIVIDDASLPEIQENNRLFAEGKNLSYFENAVNFGRAAGRNNFLNYASGSHLLFLDDDSTLVSKDFIKNYLKHIDQAVVCGGRIYPDASPGNRFSLHYNYGKKVETQALEKRQVVPHRGFQTNNFMVSREVLVSIPFDETLTTYGHEDTLFGYKLKQADTPIIHIENPVIHTQLDDNETFLIKSREALHNLQKLYIKYGSDFAQDVRLLRVYENLKKSGVTRVFKSSFKLSRKRWEKKLKSHKPSMRLFAAYKLGYFCSL